MTDARVEAFLTDILALEGENPDAIREGVHVTLADCTDIFKAQEVNRRMKDKAVHAFRRLRNGSHQFVRVEHVHVNDGGQAVIGNVGQQDMRG